MISVLHEAGKQLIRERPGMLLQLLGDQLGLDVPVDAEVLLNESDLRVGKRWCARPSKGWRPWSPIPKNSI